MFKEKASYLVTAGVASLHYFLKVTIYVRRCSSPIHRFSNIAVLSKIGLQRQVNTILCISLLGKGFFSYILVKVF